MTQFINSTRTKRTTRYSGKYSYPDWVRGVAATGYEPVTFGNPEDIKLWKVPEQSKPKCRCPGYFVRGKLIHDCLLQSAIAYGDLCHLIDHPHTIPTAWNGLIVYDWASVVDSEDRVFLVPGLDCRERVPHITWTELKEQWGVHMPAALQRLRI